uniref:Uncharacterized protein n=1 Tax=Pithovirus LCPAC101 TaxID=2506586 RepID=A0A481Z394_9VIRU|nr:MAG: hypothetical protein LCPAC101_02070 [Pithovirus LCPAC101]
MSSTTSDVCPREYIVIIPENEFTKGFEHNYTPYSKGIYYKTTVIANNKTEAIKKLILGNNSVQQYLGYKYHTDYAIVRFMILCIKDDSLVDKLHSKLYKFFDENDIEIEEDDEVVPLLESHDFGKLFNSVELSILKDLFRRLIKYQTLFGDACGFGVDYDFGGSLSKDEMSKLANHLRSDCILFDL